MSEPRFLGLVLRLGANFGLGTTEITAFVLGDSQRAVELSLERHQPADAARYTGLVVPLVSEVPVGRPCEFCEGGGTLYTWAFTTNRESVEFPRASDLAQKSRVCPKCEGTGKERP